MPFEIERLLAAGSSIQRVRVPSRKPYPTAAHTGTAFGLTVSHFEAARCAYRMRVSAHFAFVTLLENMCQTMSVYQTVSQGSSEIAGCFVSGPGVRGRGPLQPREPGRCFRAPGGGPEPRPLLALGAAL